MSSLPNKRSALRVQSYSFRVWKLRQNFQQIFYLMQLQIPNCVWISLLVTYKRASNNISFWSSRTIGFSMASMMICFRLFQKIPKGIWIFNRFFKAKQIEIKQRTWFKEKCSLLNDENCPLVVIYRRLSQYYLTMSWPRLKTGLHFM